MQYLRDRVQNFSVGKFYTATLAALYIVGMDSARVRFRRRKMRRAIKWKSRCGRERIVFHVTSGPF